MKANELRIGNLTNKGEIVSMITKKEIQKVLQESAKKTLKNDGVHLEIVFEKQAEAIVKLFAISEVSGSLPSFIAHCVHDGFEIVEEETYCAPIFIGSDILEECHEDENEYIIPLLVRRK